MSHERTIRQFVDAVNAVFGQRMEILYSWFFGLELRMEGLPYALGKVGEERMLTVAEQEAICRYFDLDPRLLGLDAPIG